MISTFAADKRAPEAEVAGVAPSERSQAPSAASQDHTGLLYPDIVMLSVDAGDPLTAAEARVAFRAKVNCGAGEAWWPASAWLRKVDGVPCRLCGAGRSLVRKNPALPESWLSTCEPELRTAVANGASPPENATRPLSGAVIAGSIGRTERTGPTSFGMAEWNTAT